MKKRPPATLEEAAEVLARLRSLRAECPQCERIEERMIPGPMIPPGPGWNPSHCEWAWIKPCSECAATPMYPWAAYLDAERLQAYLNSNGNPGVIVYDSLKALVHG
jgi:hypothetical protein